MEGADPRSLSHCRPGRALVRVGANRRGIPIGSFRWILRSIDLGIHRFRV
jgi:hypothetical protein